MTMYERHAGAEPSNAETERTSTRPLVTIVHRDIGALMGLAVALGHNGFSVTAIEPFAVVPVTRAALADEPAALVVGLDSAEDVPAIAELAAAAAPATVVLVPPDINTEDVVSLSRAAGATVLVDDSPTAVIVAELIAGLARRRVAS